jgi:hypothetical protein
MNDGSYRRRRRTSRDQGALFDWAENEAVTKTQMTTLDRRFVIDALRDIARFSTEPHIRRIAEDVLFAHRISIDRS